MLPKVVSKQNHGLLIFDYASDYVVNSPFSLEPVEVNNRLLLTVFNE